VLFIFFNLGFLRNRAPSRNASVPAAKVSRTTISRALGDPLRSKPSLVWLRNVEDREILYSRPELISDPVPLVSLDSAAHCSPRPSPSHVP